MPGLNTLPFMIYHKEVRAIDTLNFNRQDLVI